MYMFVMNGIESPTEDTYLQSQSPYPPSFYGGYSEADMSAYRYRLVYHFIRFFSIFFVLKFTFIGNNKLKLILGGQIMKKTALTVVGDSFFVFLVTFILTFVVFYYYLGYPISFILSSLLSITLSTATFFLLRKKFFKDSLKRSEAEFLKKIGDQFLLMSEIQATNEICKAYKLDEKEIKTDNEFTYINEKIVFCKFTFNGLSPADIAEVYKKMPTNSKAIVFSIEFNQETKTLADKLNIELISLQTLYSVMKKVNYYPEIKIDLADKKPKFKEVLKGMFLKSHAKNYLLAGIMLVFLSFLTPFKIYYLIFGGVFLIFSVLCRFFGKSEEPKNAI